MDTLQYVIVSGKEVADDTESEICPCQFSKIRHRILRS